LYVYERERGEVPEREIIETNVWCGTDGLGEFEYESPKIMAGLKDERRECAEKFNERLLIVVIGIVRDVYFEVMKLGEKFGEMRRFVEFGSKREQVVNSKRGQ
jgi:hypothetical protein